MLRNTKLPSNYKFGLLFICVFLVLSVYPYSGSNETMRYCCLFIAAFIGLITVTAPSLLAPFNYAWMKLGELMGRIVNTSFNVRGEPIVNRPEDAFYCLMGAEIEFLAIGNGILRKENQNLALVKDYKNSYELN